MIKMWWRVVRCSWNWNWKWWRNTGDRDMHYYACVWYSLIWMKVICILCFENTTNNAVHIQYCLWMNENFYNFSASETWIFRFFHCQYNIIFEYNYLKTLNKSTESTFLFSISSFRAISLMFNWWVNAFSIPLMENYVLKIIF